jgi:ribosome-associated protein
LRPFLFIAPGVQVPSEEVSAEYSRASGPGGQNVNKVETRVTLRFSLATSSSIPPADRERMMQKLAPRLTKKGEILVSCGNRRDRSQNQEEAFDRLEEMLRLAYAVPRARKKTRPSRGSKERRLASKRETSARKRGRKSPKGDE